MKTDNYTKDQQYKINMIAILEDIQDQYISELQPELKHGMKQIINKASIHVKQFIKYCDRIFSDDNQIDFGVTADELRKIIDEIYIK